MSTIYPSRGELQPRLITNVLLAYESAGDAWLDRLADILREAASRWGLELQPAFPGLSFNYVAPATLQDGTSAVLKAGVPHPDRPAEIVALQVYNGDGMPRVYEADIDLGLVVIERYEPGSMLVEVADDDEATRIAASIVRRGWRPAPDDPRLDRVSRWFDGLGELRKRFDGGPGPFSEFAVAQAERLLGELTESTAAPMLIHGDFHHYNILRRGDEWAAIDPKGVIGDPSFDFAMLLMNPLNFRDWPDWESRLVRRVNILEAEGFDRPRIVGWLRAFSVLSNWWSVVGDDPTLPARLAFVERIAGMDL